MNIIEKYYDFEIHPIEYFIDKIENEVNSRDLKGLTNNKVNFIRVSKEHPIVLLLQQELDPRDARPKEASILPAIGVTPGNPVDEAKTLGFKTQSHIFDEDWNTNISEIRNIPMKQRVQSGIITDSQIDNILQTYQRLNENEKMFCEQRKYEKKEEVSISVWCQSADRDITISSLVDSVLRDILSGYLGDNSKIKNMEISSVKGLTNFQFGRILYGTEFTISFLNTYNNYMIFTENRTTDLQTEINTRIPGEE